MSLWDHQPKAINDIRNALARGYKRVILQMVCGSGKTRVASEIIKLATAKGKKVLFIADRIALVNQTSRVFHSLGIDHGVVMANDYRYAPWKLVQICSAKSLMRRKIPDADLIIVDEAACHYDYLSEYMKTCSLVPVIGLDGLPLTTGLGNHYETVVRGPSTKELIKKGILVSPICYGPDSIDTKGLKMAGNDYNQKQLDKRVEVPKLTADIVNSYLELGEGRKAIMIPQNVAFSKSLVNEFNQAGVPFAHIDANTPDEDRQVYYQQLKDDELMGISSVGCLTRGFDETSVSCIILAFVTRSPMKYIQAAWRAGRAHEGKEDFIVLDHGGNVERLGWPDDEFFTELCTGEKTEAERVKEQLKEKEEKELLPKRCPSCHHLVEAKIFTCPKCNHIFARKSEVVVNDGELVELKRKQSPADKRNKTTSKADKQSFYSSAIAYGYQRGYKEGWAANKYKEYFGVWPNAMNKQIGEITQEFKNYLTSQNIRYANRNSKQVEANKINL